MKTIQQALLDEIYYPIGVGIVENKLIARELDGSTTFTSEVAKSKTYKGALADCLCSLIQSISISEADKSVGALSNADKKMILRKANDLYREIGEEEVDFAERPVVYIGG